MTDRDLAVTITDPLVRAFGAVEAEIEIAIRKTEPGSRVRLYLVDRLAQVTRAWDAFQNDPLGDG